MIRVVIGVIFGVTLYSPVYSVTLQEELQRLGSRAAVMKYHYPAPKAGSWTAMYSRDLSNKFNLPKEGINEKLDNYIKYIELVSEESLGNSLVQEEKKQGRWDYPDNSCYINMLMTKNHDISLAGPSGNIDQKERIKFHFHDLRKPLQAINSDKYLATYRHINFNNSHTIHSSDLINGYDYFSIMMGIGCRDLTKALKEGYNLKLSGIPRASVFGEYILDLQALRVKKDIDNNKWYRNITIPQVLLINFYKDTPIPEKLENEDGEPLSIKDWLKIPLVLPLVAAMAFDSVGSGTDSNDIGKFPAPEGPTHFKLDKPKK